MVAPLAFSFLLIAAELNPAPSASPLAPKQIIDIRVSPFCRTLRENVYHVIAGLRQNDAVIARGRELLNRMARDQMLDPYENGIGGASISMDQYQLGEIVGDAGHNISRVAGLLAEVEQLPSVARKSDGAAVLAIERLEAVAQAQRASLNVLSGIYETAALENLFSKGDGMQGALGRAGLADKNLELGDSVLGSGSEPTLHAGTQGGAAAAASAQDLTAGELATGSTEEAVLPALQPLIDRCEATR